MKLNPMILISCLLCLLRIAPTIGEFIGIGNCPEPTAVTDPTTLNGVWFEQRRYDSAFSYKLRCPIYTFSPATGDLTSLNVNAVYKLTGRPFNLNARLIPTPAGSTSNYAVQYSSINQNLLQQNFRVIYFTTDVAVLFSCRSFGFFYSAQIIVLSSVRVPDPSVITTAIDAIRGTTLPIAYLKTTDQSFC